MFVFLEKSAWLPPLFIAIMVAIFVGAHFIVQRMLKVKDANEIAGFVAHQIGILYAVLLGFIAVTSWSNFDRSALTAENERDALADLYRIANNLPDKTKEPIEDLSLRYATLMVTEEWPAMQNGGQSQEAAQASEGIFNALASFQPKNKNESNLQKQGLKEATNFLNLRQERLKQNTEGLPNIIWWILLVGAILMISITFFIHPINRTRQLIMTGMLTVLIGMQLSLINEFIYPFRGAVSVGSEGWKTMVDRISTHQFY
jgi:hypothetical protein